MKNYKLWSILCVILVLLPLLAMATMTAVIDPFFHYHAPLSSLEYPLTSQRYQNDGIVRHFDYDALITGTSMTENFKTSEFDALFGTHAIKVSYSGGTFAELVANLRQALESNPNLKTVLFCIDEWFLFNGRDMILADGEYPTYLYDDNPFNDVKYLLNKEVFLENTLGVLEYTAAGHTTTSFDAYGSWEFETGKEAVLAAYDRPEITTGAEEMTQEEADNLVYVLETELVALAEEYPDTEFLYYFPPYSILDWDLHVRQRSAGCYTDAFRLATQTLLQAENIRVFSFYTDFDTITDLSNYRDVVHHNSTINTLLLQRIAAGEYELTPETNQAHWDTVEAFYTGFDYEQYFE